MKCEKCNNTEASFHFKSNINGQISEHHMCTDCAKESGLYASMSPSFTSDFFSSMLSPFQGFMPMLSGYASGMLMQPFAMPVYSMGVPSGTPGASPIPEASEVKIPGDAGEDLKKKREISALRHQMNEAVKAEKFEDAAVIRDKLHSLENQQ